MDEVLDAVKKMIDNCEAFVVQKSSESRREFEDIMINIKEENKRQFGEKSTNLRRKTEHILTVCRKLLKKVFTQQLGKCGIAFWNLFNA